MKDKGVRRVKYLERDYIEMVPRTHAHSFPHFPMIEKQHIEIPDISNYNSCR